MTAKICVGGPIILASTSPRRLQLLTQAGLMVKTLSVEIDESVAAGECAADYIERMVRAKAAQAIVTLTPSLTVSTSNVSPSVQLQQDLEKALIITADTIGVLPSGEVLVKPKDVNDALRMWRQMSGATHQVRTAVALTLVALSPVAEVVEQVVLVETTEVTFSPLTEPQMLAYWQSGEPVDKAGGYAIQGGAASWVERMDGSYTNVVGLPVAQTIHALAELLTRHQISFSYVHQPT